MRTMLRQKTNGPVRELDYSCSGAGTIHVRCSIEWRIRRYRFRGTAYFHHYLENNELYWYFTFNGKKQKSRCQSCRTKRLSWE